MVEAFYNLNKAYSRQEVKLNRALRTIQDQERILGDNRIFIDECLSHIFEVVSLQKGHIVKTMQEAITKKRINYKHKKKDKDIDPFNLY